MGICCFFAVFLSLRCPFQGLALRPMLLARPLPAPSVSCRAPPCNPAAPFEKGVDPKTFLRMGNILSMEGQRTRNTNRQSGFAFTHRKKFLRVPRVRFFKNAPLAGCGTASHKRRASQSAGCALSGGTASHKEKGF